MLTNCINCGAPLTSKKCAYCGTDHSGNFESNFNDEFRGTLTYKGVTYSVYMAECEVKHLQDLGYVNRDGVMCRSTLEKTKRRFTLIEY